MIRFDGVTIDRNRRSISYAGNTLLMTSPLQFRLACALLLAGPQTTAQLFHLIYHDRSDGGPLSGYRLIDVMQCRLNKKFSAMGLQCNSGGRFGSTQYWVAPPMVCEVAA